jgi:hypothetical protein
MDFIGPVASWLLAGASLGGTILVWYGLFHIQVQFRGNKLIICFGTLVALAASYVLLVRGGVISFGGGSGGMDASSRYIDYDPAYRGFR